jgi:hypothetical protein
VTVSSLQHNSNSPLLRLPAEIRNQIYNYVIGRHHYEIRTRGSSGITYYLSPGSASSPSWREQNGLSQTCRQLHHETSALPFRNNMFGIRMMEDHSTLNKWMGLLQPYQASAIQSIYFCLFTYAKSLETLKTLLSNFSGIKGVRTWIIISCGRILGYRYEQVMQSAGFKLISSGNFNIIWSKMESYERS